MTFRKAVFNIAAGAAILLVQLGSMARADITTDPVTGFVYRQPGNLLSAPDPGPGGNPTGTFLGTFTANGINFFVPPPDSNPLAVFIASGGGNPAGGPTPLTSTAAGVLALTQPMSLQTGPPAGQYSTAIKFQSNAAVTFLPGTYTVTHDDGVVVYIGNTRVVNAPAPTSPTNTTFTIASTTTGIFTAFYEATNGNPEQMRVTFTPSAVVPEPASVFLFGTATVAFCAIQRRRLRKI